MVRTSRRLLQELGREPTNEEIADEMGLIPERVREINGRVTMGGQVGPVELAESESTSGQS